MFLISKITYFFLTPSNWILFLIITKLFVKSSFLQKRLLVAIVALFIFFGNEVVYTKLVLAWQPKPVKLKENTVYEAGILLGGLTSFDKNKTGFLNAATDRLVEICILYKTKKIKKIIISGGSIYADRPKEADFLNQKLLSLGVPAGDLIIENRSKTTFENAVYTKKIIDSIKIAPPFILVTSAIHCPRAERVFAKAGLQVIAFPSDFKVFPKKFDFADYVIPKTYTLNDWASFLKEVFGVLAYKVLNKA